MREALPVGDYGWIGKDGVRDNVVVERKSKSDLWGSYGGRGYERERAKILRAKERGEKFILAIECSIWEVRRGHEYYVKGEVKAAKKDGLSLVRQLMTVSRKYGVEVWFCNNREEMAFRIAEYFMARERVKR